MRINQITVLRDRKRIQMIIEMPDLSRYMTSQVPELPRRLFRVFPSLAKHKCNNEHGGSFRKECRCTEIPHLFEHLVLELQGQAQSVTVLRGETAWNWQETPRGQFSVWVDYDNELLVLGAIHLAERMMQALDGDAVETLDMTAEIGRLRDLARIGRELEPPTWGFSAGNRTAPHDGGESLPSLPKPRRRRVVASRTATDESLEISATSRTATRPH